MATDFGRDKLTTSFFPEDNLVRRPLQMGLTQEDQQRFARYSRLWDFYNGRHWQDTPERKDGDSNITLNFCRLFVNKGASFLTGKGWTIKDREMPYSRSQLEFLSQVWRVSNKDIFTFEMAQMGGTFGDVYVTVLPDNNGGIAIKLIPPMFVTPFWHPADRDVLLGARIQFPLNDTDGYRSGNQTKRRMLTILLDAVNISQYIDNTLISSQPHGIGEVPLVVVRNRPESGASNGTSDIATIIPVNKLINEKVTDINDIISYHACVDVETEILTKEGWKKNSELRVGEEVLGLDPETDTITWQNLEAVHEYEHEGPLVRWDNRIDALTTPNHRWLAERYIGRRENKRYEREFVRTSEAGGGELAAADLRDGSRIIVGGGTPTHFISDQVFDDELVETIGWLITEGHIVTLPSGNQHSILTQSISANPEFVDDIRRLQAYWEGRGETFTEFSERENGVINWYLGTEMTKQLLTIAPNKSLPASFLSALTYRQAEILFKILIDADGTRYGHREMWFQDDQGRINGFQMLAAMLGGKRTRAYKNTRGNGVVDIYQTRTIEILSTTNSARIEENTSNKVWCPTLRTGVWFARRNGHTYWTGNSPVTIAYGVKIKQLQRGARKVWSAPSYKEAKIENLTMDSDLAAANAHIKSLMDYMFMLAEMPVAAFGMDQAISNTTGVALQVLFQPLMDATRVKQKSYGAALANINRLIIKYGIAYGYLERYKFSTWFDLQEYYQTDIDWANPLPMDELLNLNMIINRLNSGLITVADALSQLGVANVKQYIEQLMEDRESGVNIAMVKALAALAPKIDVNSGKQANLGGIARNGSTVQQMSDLALGHGPDNQLSQKVA